MHSIPSALIVLALFLGMLGVFVFCAFRLSSRADDESDDLARQIANGERPIIRRPIGETPAQLVGRGEGVATAHIKGGNRL